MKTIDFSYYIERYNCGEMSESEKTWFEKELKGNEKLRNEVNLRKQTDNILRNQDILSLRSKLSRIEMERKAVRPTPRFSRGKVFKSAAAITILVILGSITVFNRGNLSSDDLLMPFDKPYQPSAGQRSMQININEDFDQGLEYFNTSDYRNAALYFTKVVEANPKDMAATLLNGISNYEDTQYAEAKVSFVKVIDNDKNLYIDHAQWYLAECYIRTDEKEKAVKLLETIKSEGGFYSKNARKLLRTLN
jgi:tetratricopeptide (TPR) repeat protein